MIKLFSSESVTEGHPDKVADLISDAILDACLSQDPDSRVACETAVTTNYVLVFGEMTTRAVIDIDTIVRKAIKTIGYDRPGHSQPMRSRSMCASTNSRQTSRWVLTMRRPGLVIRD